ncbi:class F sortase [Paenarthrobacter sp. 4246]|uniref:class F sortase n=1 Tax=Paenarthrobacter sp. 4246 TaxID=3156456 RepID=UPI0033910D7B
MTSTNPKRRRATPGYRRKDRGTVVFAAMAVLLMTACGTAAPGGPGLASNEASNPTPTLDQAAPSLPPAGSSRPPASAALQGTTPTQPAAAPAPTSLQVAGTSIDMPVIPVGVASGGAMEIPETFYEAGWYRFGPAPGAAQGAAVLAGHIDTTSDQAPFSQLKSLPAGTLVTVGRQGAPSLRYRVVSVTLMAKDAFDGESLFRRTGPHELKVVTCGGRWLDERMDYSDNVIVTAVLE